ncbi:MAG: hypothetical protein JW954_07780 [Dehalococcoidaceae bacterium]|nr:hypothetical protein [Dehalococcoidaceae bacterium]
MKNTQLLKHLAIIIIVISGFMAVSCSAPAIELPGPAPETNQPPVDDVEKPGIVIPEIKIQMPDIPNIIINGANKPAEDFPYIKAGEGSQFLKKPLFLTGWTQNYAFFDEIPQVMAGWAPSLPENPAEQAWFRGYLSQFLQRNRHYLGAGITPMQKPGDKPTPEPQLATVDINGNPIRVIKPGMGDRYSDQYWMNLLNPGWQQELTATGKAMIDMGVEGVAVDESTFNRQVIYEAGGTFDEYSMAGFTKYLAGKYSANELKTRFGITDIGSFNLRDYLAAKNLRDTWNKETWPPMPITYEFGQFQMVESIKFWRQFAAELKNYAAATYGREFFISLNASPQFVTGLMPADFLDYLTCEHFYFSAKSEVPKSSVVLKLAEDMADYTAVLVEITHDRGNVPGNTSELFKYVFADIYPSNGKMIVDGEYFKTMHNWNYLDNAKIAYDVGEAARYVAYADSHPEFYGLDEPARVAFINSIASRLGASIMPVEERNTWTDHGVKGVIEMLLNLNVPVDTLLAGDGELFTDTLSPAEMGSYDVVILPSVFMASDEEVRLITEYVKNGGNIIQIAHFATHDKTGTPVSRPELETLANPGEHKLGKGSWYTFAEDIGDDYYRNQDNDVAYLPVQRTNKEAVLLEFKNALFGKYEPEITTTAPPTVNIRRYAGAEGLVLHLSNYNFNQTTDTFTPVQPFEITVSLPSGTVPASAVLHDFETGNAEKIEMTVADGKATLGIPGLYAYSVIELN